MGLTRQSSHSAAFSWHGNGNISSHKATHNKNLKFHSFTEEYEGWEKHKFFFFSFSLCTSRKKSKCSFYSWSTISCGHILQTCVVPTSEHKYSLGFFSFFFLTFWLFLEVLIFLSVIQIVILCFEIFFCLAYVLSQIYIYI